MFQMDTVISVVCIYWDLPYIILSWGLFKHMHPTLGRKRLPVLNRIQWCSSQHFGKLVNRWRCPLAPHLDIRSVERGGLWIKDKYSVFEDKLQNSHYAQICTYILSNKLLRSDSVQSTGLNESKKKKKRKYKRAGGLMEGREGSWGTRTSLERGEWGQWQADPIYFTWLTRYPNRHEEQSWDTYLHWFPFPPVKHLKSQSLCPGSWLCLSTRLPSQVFSASAREDIL